MSTPDHWTARLLSSMRDRNSLKNWPALLPCSPNVRVRQISGRSTLRPLFTCGGVSAAGEAKRRHSAHFRQSHPLVPVILRPSASNVAPYFKCDHPAKAREHVGAIHSIRILYSTCSYKRERQKKTEILHDTSENNMKTAATHTCEPVVVPCRNRKHR